MGGATAPLRDARVLPLVVNIKERIVQTHNHKVTDSANLEQRWLLLWVIPTVLCWITVAAVAYFL